MKASINHTRLNSMLRGIQKSIDLFPGQGYGEVYFTAQFMRGKQKQNSIERGELATFATQIRTYAKTEDADSVRIEFFDEATGKSIYSKVLTDLQSTESVKSGSTENQVGFSGFGGFNGLGEAQIAAFVNKQVDAREQAKDFVRQAKELEELRTKFTAMESEKAEIEASLEAKKGIEYIVTMIGGIFPGIAPLFSGTPLAQAAGFLAGTNDAAENSAQSADGETQSIAAMVAEFANTLDKQDASAFHLICIAFEKDKSKIRTTLHQLMAANPAS